MKKSYLLKSQKSVLVLVVMLITAAFYHTTVSGENKCIELGNSKSQCAKLLD